MIIITNDNIKIYNKIFFFINFPPIFRGSAGIINAITTSIEENIDRQS